MNNNFYFDDGTEFLLPKYNLEEKTRLIKNGTIKEWKLVSDNKLYIMVNIKSKKSISNKQFKNIINSGHYKKCNSIEIYDKIIKIGNVLNKKIIEIENKNRIYKGYNHIDNFFDDYADKVLDDDIEDLCLKFCNEYSCTPFDDSQYIKFCKFIYATWEMCYVSTSMIVNTNNYTNNGSKHMERYFDSDDMWYVLVKLLDNYLETYKTYDKMQYCICEKMENDLSLDSFELIAVAYDIVVPVIFEAKNLICSITSGKRFNICEECFSVFRVTNRSDEKTCSYECKRAKDNKREKTKKRYKDRHTTTN